MWEKEFYPFLLNQKTERSDSSLRYSTRLSRLTLSLSNLSSRPKGPSQAAVHFSTLRSLIQGVIPGLYFSAFPPGRRRRPLWAGGRIPTSEFRLLSSALCFKLYAPVPRTPQPVTRTSQPATRTPQPATRTQS